MRLRILELPTRPDGDSYRTPWVLIADEVKEDLPDAIAERFEIAARNLGAEGALIFPFRVELPDQAGVR
jgi:hypothetical protein